MWPWACPWRSDVISRCPCPRLTGLQQQQPLPSRACPRAVTCAVPSVEKFLRVPRLTSFESQMFPLQRGSPWLCSLSEAFSVTSRKCYSFPLCFYMGPFCTFMCVGAGQSPPQLGCVAPGHRTHVCFPPSTQHRAWHIVGAQQRVWEWTEVPAAGERARKRLCRFTSTLPPGSALLTFGATLPFVEGPSCTPQDI